MVEHDGVSGINRSSHRILYNVRWIILALLLAVGWGLAGCTELTVRPSSLRPTVVSSASSRPQPEITISPSSGSADVYIEVRGRNWPANSLVLMTLGDDRGRSGILAATNADSEGNVTTNFPYPQGQRWLTPGPYTVIAYTGNGDRQASTTFTVGPESIPAPAATVTSTTTVTATTTATQTATSTPSIELTPTPTATPSPLPTETPATVIVNDWRGEYWPNDTLSGAPLVVRDDPAIIFDWDRGSPADGIPGDHFSARWSRVLNFDEGVYRFFLEIDDGARLFIDDTLVIDEWREGSSRVVAVDYPMGVGIHSLRVEYFERAERAKILFWWERQDATSG